MEFYADAYMDETRVYEDNETSLDYVKSCGLKIYKMPEEDDEAEKIISYGDNDEENRVCTIHGHLILTEQAWCDGEDICDLCDAEGKVLEHIATSIASEGNDLGDVFAIDSIEFGQACDSSKTLKAVFHSLARLIFKAFNVFPESLAIFPLPLPYEKSMTEKIKEAIAVGIMRDIMDAFFDSIENKASNNSDEEDESGLQEDVPKAYFTLDEEQENYLLDKFSKDNPYPLSAKNEPLWFYLESIGFEELGESMVLVLENR